MENMIEQNDYMEQCMTGLQEIKQDRKTTSSFKAIYPEVYYKMKENLQYYEKVIKI